MICTYEVAIITARIVTMQF